MNTELINSIIADLEGDAKSMILHIDTTNDPFETGYIKGYHDALMGHVHLLREYISNNE